ncbi:hypothetical protein [Benzoatithermus flavus]|uniref:Uncharacterized protein n=1 Tax=Benzoatithermus flavus TaxID=3108223 RepID=A0ABU8XVZ8_9PROT
MSEAQIHSLPARLLAWCGIGNGLRRASGHCGPPAPPATLGRASLAPLKGWREIARGLEGPVVPPAAFRRISGLLRVLRPDAVERGRLALLLDLVGAGRPLEQLADMLPEIAEWRLLLARNLNEAEDLGLVMVASSRVRLSRAGRERLAALEAEGFSREAWLFIERCLRERPEAICSSCAAPNRIHWYWDEFDCRRCGRRNATATGSVVAPPRHRPEPHAG